MGYLGIDNLYKNQEILMFKRCYAMEKIHGTSAHISLDRSRQLVFGPIIGVNEDARRYTEAEWQERWPDKIELHFFSGGEKHENFIKLFNHQDLENKFRAMNIKELIVFGEAYGGKQQGMSGTYGKELKFIAFDVKLGGNWLAVPNAESVCAQLGIEFVHYEEVATDLDVLNALSEADSVQAVRNGVGPGHIREGVVLRTLVELRKNNGERIIAKHKNEKFQETAKKREVSKERLEVLTEAQAIADEWVTRQRLMHVLDRFPDATITETGAIIKAMVEDVLKESVGEIVFSKEAQTAIGKKTALIFKEYIKQSLYE